MLCDGGCAVYSVRAHIFYSEARSSETTIHSRASSAANFTGQAGRRRGACVTNKNPSMHGNLYRVMQVFAVRLAWWWCGWGGTRVQRRRPVSDAERKWLLLGVASYMSLCNATARPRSHTPLGPHCVTLRGPFF